LATTEQSLYNIGVRKALNEMGVSDERISYDPNTGYVKVDSVPIIKPQLNVGGTTYTTQADINSIAGDVNRLNRLYNLQSQVLNPQQQTNPYDQQISQILSTLQQRIQNPTPINPYATPQYAAAQAQAQQQAQQATRSAQEALGAAGLGRSSVLTDRAQAIQNQANQYLMTQVVPQIIAQEQARQQQEFQNLANILNMLGQQQSVYDTRARNQFGQAFDVLDFMTRQQQRQFENEMARRAAELSETELMARLTGRLPDGTPTTAEQQRQLENEWRIAEAFGTITPTLARTYGIPEGTPTLQAKQIAFNQQMAQQELGLRSRELEARLAQMAAENARAQARLAMEQEELRNNREARNFLGRLMDDLGELESEQDIRDFLRLNAGEISSILGYDTYNRIVQSALAPFEQQRAAQGDVYQQAVRLAQSDPDWAAMDSVGRQSLIDQYVRMLSNR